jgi:hypothetical protein
MALGFDQAPNNTGWAAWSDADDAVPIFDTITMSNYGKDDQRMAKDFEFEIVGLLNRFRPDAVYFEQIIIPSGFIDTNTLYAQFTVACTIQVITAQRGIPAFMVEIPRWRKRFLGRANAPKWMVGKTQKGRDVLKEMAMIECARRNLLPKNDHEAEAIGITDYGLAHLSFDYKKRTKADVERRQQHWRRLEMQK